MSFPRRRPVASFRQPRRRLAALRPRFDPLEGRALPTAVVSPATSPPDTIELGFARDAHPDSPIAYSPDKKLIDSNGHANFFRVDVLVISIGGRVQSNTENIKVNLYWATGPTKADIIDKAKNHETATRTVTINHQNTHANTVVSLYFDRFNYPYSQKNQPPPPEATHLVAVIDPDGAFAGEHDNPANNVAAVKLIPKYDLHAISAGYDPNTGSLLLTYEQSGNPDGFMVGVYDAATGKPYRAPYRVVDLFQSPRWTVAIPITKPAKATTLRIVLDPPDGAHPKGLIDETNEGNNQVTAVAKPFIEYIPEIEQNLGWTKAAALQREWFNGSLVTSPTKGDHAVASPDKGDVFDFALNKDMKTVTMDWVLGDAAGRGLDATVDRRAKTAYDAIADETLNSANGVASQKAQALLTARAAAALKSAPAGKTFEFGNIPLTAGNLKAFHSQYTQSISIAHSILHPSSFHMDPLMATLGDFRMYAIPVGTATKLSTGGIHIEIRQVKFYVIDSFDFQGTQPLGTWKYSNYVQFTPLLAPANSTSVANATYRAWRDANQRGRDFLVVSDVKTKDVSIKF